MSIQNLYPNIKPTLLLDFSNTKALDSRVTFTRASTATYYGTQTAKAEENLLLQSQTFDNASWTKSNAAVSGTDTIVAPDGTTTAEEVRDGTASNIHNVFQGVTLASGTTYVASVFLKNVDRQYAILAVSGGVSAYASAKFDLTGGTSTANQAAGSGWSVTSVAMTSVGSGWYRCVLVFVSGISGSCNVRIGLASNGTTFTTNGSGLESYTGTDLKIAVWGAQLEQRSSVTAYTPTTTQTITNYIPVLETAASGVARFDHNPTTFESLGLLIEESRTNLVTYSEQFDDAAWTKNNSSITANTIVAPDGALTGDKFIANTVNTNHTLTQAISHTTGTSYTLTCFYKAAGVSFASLTFSAGFTGTQINAFYDLSTGVVGTVSAGSTATITPVGNGWYRCSLTITATATASTNVQIRLAASSTSAPFAGNDFNGAYIWGAQLEAGAFPTSYIQTVASQVTRSADAASMTGTNFSSWYNQAEGTIYSEANTFDASVIRVAVSINDGTTPNRILSTHGASPKGFVAVNGITQMSQGVSPVVFSNNTFSKMSVAYAVNNGNAAANGTIGTLDTAMTIPVVTQLQIGSQTGSATQTLNGTIKKLAYYPLRVTNAQLQVLTS